MPWAWVTAPPPSTPTPASSLEGSGRDSRVHSAAARQAPGSHLAPALLASRAAYYSRSTSVCTRDVTRLRAAVEEVKRPSRTRVESAP